MKNKRWLIILAALEFLFIGYTFCSCVLDMFGLIEYDVPLSQSQENIVKVELVYYDYDPFKDTVLLTLTDDKIAPFVQDLVQTDVARWANDPPTVLGHCVVKVYYADGGFDMLGDSNVSRYTATGDYARGRGGYYLPDLDLLFEKYLNDA